MISPSLTKNYTSYNNFQAFMQTEINKAQRELKIKNYGSKTIKSYLYSLQEYFPFNDDDFTNLDQKNIRNFYSNVRENRFHLKAEVRF